MKTFREKNGGLGSKWLVEKQIGADFLRHQTYTVPAIRGSEETVKTNIYDLEPHIQEEKELLKLKGTMPQEIERVEYKFNAKEIQLKEKKETAQSSNRRRKMRVYFP